MTISKNYGTAVNTVLKNHRLGLEFSSCGALVSLNYAGEEFIAVNSPREIFTLMLRRREDGKTVEVNSLDFTRVQPVLEEVADGGLLRILFRGCRKFELLEAEVVIRLRRDSDFSSWNITVQFIFLPPSERLFCFFGSRFGLFQCCECGGASHGSVLVLVLIENQRVMQRTSEIFADLDDVGMGAVAMSRTILWC